jgi:cation transporter-like permease
VNSRKTDLAPVALFAIGIPSQLLFLILVSFLGLGQTVVNFGLIVVYLGTSVCLTLCLLVISYYLSRFLWRRKLDPDVSILVPISFLFHVHI